MRTVLEILHQKKMLAPRPFPLFCLYLFQKPIHRGWMLHHRILKHSLKRLCRPRDLVKSLIQGLLWYGVYLWIYSYKIVTRQGAKVKKQHGIALIRQWTDLILLNLAFHLPLYTYYRHHLYLKKNRHKIHGQLYVSSLPHVHDYSNRNYDGLNPAIQLMADKPKFAQTLETNGFAGIKTLAVITAPSQIPSFFQKQDVFCKPVTGSQSRGAFQLTHHSETSSYTALPINGSPISDPVELNNFLSQSVAVSETLVQEMLVDHPDIAALSKSKEITTLRLVTGRFNSDEVRVIYVQIEIPRSEKIIGRQFYNIYPLDTSDLDVSSHWRKTHQANLKYDTGLVLSSTIKKMLARACDLCAGCHKKLFPIRSVGFDVALSPQGPVIIEANYNWDIELLFRVIRDLKNNSSGALWLKELYESH